MASAWYDEPGSVEREDWSQIEPMQLTINGVRSGLIDSGDFVFGGFPRKKKDERPQNHRGLVLI